MTSPGPTVGTVNGDTWTCPCGAEGINGRPALSRHVTVLHDTGLYPLHPVADTPEDRPDIIRPERGRGSIVPEGINSKLVRSWARANGWPLLGDRGRLPQQAIDQYMQAFQ